MSLNSHLTLPSSYLSPANTAGDPRRQPFDCDTFLKPCRRWKQGEHVAKSWRTGASRYLDLV